MANVVGAEGLARWGFSLGSALLLHGAALIGGGDRAGAEAAAARPALVWLDAAPTMPAASEAPAIGALTAAAPAQRPPKQRRARAKPSAAPGASAGPATQANAPEAPPDPAVAPRGDDGATAAHAASRDAASDGAAAEGRDIRATAAAGGARRGMGSASPLKPALPPGLLAFGDPCRGFYPPAAEVDHGEVRVVVRVGSDGRAGQSQVIAEMPAQQGFGGAARACVSRLRFRPARDADGSAVPGRAVLALSFDRS